MKTTTNSSVSSILLQRKSNYGDFSTQSLLAQALKDVIRSHPNYLSLSPDIKESLEMILHKISRIVNGSPTYKDSWDDICGYATLISSTLPSTND